MKNSRNLGILKWHGHVQKASHWIEVHFLPLEYIQSLRHQDTYVYISYWHCISKKKDGSLHYSMEVHWTRNKDSPNRTETFKNSIEKAGGKLVGTYYTLGQYDGVSIVEAPDDATIMSSLLSFRSQHGSSTTMTLKAFTAEETAVILKNLWPYIESKIH